jgi:ribosomal protein L40E
MAVRVEPPRGRPVERYPGLTPEERGFDPPSTPRISVEPEPPPPLWMIPSEMPHPDRSVGFVGALPDAQLPEPPPAEGLFDVPGLLERLWLARALEAAHHERPWPSATGPDGRELRTTLPSSGRSGAAMPSAPDRPVPAPSLSPLDPPAPVLATASPALETAGIVEPPRPRSWICPHCYLTNDASATTCRGCRSGTLHL